MQKIANFVGIDMAKNDFYACLSNTIEPRKFNNDVKGIKSFFKHLKRHDFQKENTLLGIESTASYHLKLCLESSSYDYEIRVINPLIVKKHNQTDLRRVKNDKKDSRLIRFCLSGGAGYAFNNDPETIILKSLVKTFFQKKKDEGKPYRVALVATMRKMTHVVHSVWTRGTPFVK